MPIYASVHCTLCMSAFIMFVQLENQFHFVNVVHLKGSTILQCTFSLLFCFSVGVVSLFILVPFYFNLSKLPFTYTHRLTWWMCTLYVPALKFSIRFISEGKKAMQSPCQKNVEHRTKVSKMQCVWVRKYHFEFSSMCDNIAPYQDNWASTKSQMKARRLVGVECKPDSEWLMLLPSSE